MSFSDNFPYVDSELLDGVKKSWEAGNIDIEEVNKRLSSADDTQFEIDTFGPDEKARFQTALLLSATSAIFLFAYASVVIALIGKKSDSDIEHKDDQTAQVFCIYSLLRRASDDLNAIFLLISRGNEVQAKVLLRSWIETMNCLVLAHLSVGFCKGMIENSGFDTAKEFWFKNIAKGRLRKKIKADLKKWYGDYSTLDDIDKYLEIESSKFGIFVHASYAGGMFVEDPTLKFNECLPFAKPRFTSVIIMDLIILKIWSLANLHFRVLRIAFSSYGDLNDFRDANGDFTLRLVDQAWKIYSPYLQYLSESQKSFKKSHDQ